MMAESEVPEDEVLATLATSGPRAGFGVLVTVLLGVLLFWVALATPPAHPGWLVMLLAMGVASLWNGWALWQSSHDSLILAATGLTTASGREVCRVTEVKSVERGMLAFKPSGGFVIRLHVKKTGAWAPGLWWRLGRTVGVGGITRSGDARTMADILSALADGSLNRMYTPEPSRPRS